jgi:hypothetical protein
MFKAQGLKLWKAMRSLDSAGFMMFDVEGNEFFTKSKMGAPKGFSSLSKQVSTKVKKVTRQQNLKQ